MSSTMRVGGIVQARMGSRRLPGKVLRPLAGQPLLQHVVERVARCVRVGQVVVSTSSEAQDDAIEAFCASRRVGCFRGEHDDVAGRFLQTLDHYGFGAFLRVSADSPLIDPMLMDRGLEVFATGRYEIVTNVLKRTFPKGQSFEIFRTDAFCRGCERMSAPEHREHVTPYFYEHANDFAIFNVSSGEDWGALNLCVDTREDLDRVMDIFSRMDRPYWACGWRQTVEHLFAVAH